MEERNINLHIICNSSTGDLLKQIMNILFQCYVLLYKKCSDAYDLFRFNVYLIGADFDVYLGMRKTISTNRWAWDVTGTPAIDLVYETSADGSYECAYIDTEEEEGNWVIYDTSCDIQRNFVCEFDLNADESELISATGKVLASLIIKEHEIMF